MMNSCGFILGIVGAVDLLRHLAFFAAIAEVRHFGHAADDLGMTQPPLSQGIQRLEQRLGVRLFDRNSRGVALTPAGAALLPAARGVLEASDRFEESAQRLAQSRSVLALGVTAGLGRVAVDLAAGAAAVTDRPMRLVVAGSAELVAGVGAHQIDVAVVRHPTVVDGTSPGAVHPLRTRLLTPAGTDLRSFVRSELPLASEPRRYHPAAHDQLVDALRRLGHPGVTVAAGEFEAVTLVAARSAAALLVGVGGDDLVTGAQAHVAHGLVVRVRTLLPTLTDGHDADVKVVTGALEAVLDRHADAT